jgi:hypothetical protein
MAKTKVLANKFQGADWYELAERWKCVEKTDRKTLKACQGMLKIKKARTDKDNECADDTLIRFTVQVLDSMWS